MDEPTREEKALIEKAKLKLDAAVQQYYSETSRAWNNDNPGMLMGWTLGMSLARVDEDGDEENMLQIESSPGLNNFTARGIAESAGEAFAAQAYGDL